MLWTTDLLIFAIVEGYLLERWAIVIEECGLFVFYDVHQSHDTENLITLPCPRPAGHDQLLWRKLLDMPKHRAQRVGLCHGGFVFARSPRIIPVDRHNPFS